MRQDRMVVGAMRLRLVVRESYSLKDKRRIVRSLKDRVCNRFNVSIAEVGSLDHRQCAELGVGAVGNDPKVLSGVLTKVLNLARSVPGVEVIASEMEFV